MNKQKIILPIIVGGILIAGLAAGGLGMLGRIPWQSGDLYSDPQGRFTIELNPG